MGDTVPHMRETRIVCTADGTGMHGQQDANWWRAYADVRFVINDAQHFTIGHASGDQCNCLIDTLRQMLTEDGLTLYEDYLNKVLRDLARIDLATGG